jgi:hypothetical protein
MRCRKTQRNLSAYLAGELGHRKTERVREHLLTCSTCARELEDLEKLNKRLDRLEGVVPSPSFEERFWRKVKETKKPESAPRRFPGPGWTLNWKWGLSTALVFLVISGGYIYWERFQTTERQRGADPSLEMAEIARDIDFYQNYEIIREMDTLIKLEKEETVPGNEEFPGNQTL